MAHNINQENGKASFATAKEKAWHGLGQVTDSAMTTGEALELAGLDFEVHKFPNFTTIEVEGKELVLESNSFSTVRMDTQKVLGGKLGKVYTVLQNTDAFEFFNYVVDESSAIIETAGALVNGEIVFISAKLPEYITIKKDVIEQYLLVTNSHDGSSGIKVMFTPVRVVCNNTLNMALKGAKNCVTVRHTRNAKDNLLNAKNILGIHNQYKQELERTYKHLQSRRMSSKNFDRFVQDLILSAAEKKAYSDGNSLDEVISTRKSNIITSITDYYHEGVGQQTPEALGTRYGAFNFFFECNKVIHICT